MNDKTIIIIPARYGSTRFEGKPLVKLAGRPLIEHVYRRVSSVADETIVATDDERIMECVIGFGGKCMMTSKTHRSGTDRIAEVLTKIDESYDIAVNVQGDEPFINPEHIRVLTEIISKRHCDIATLTTNLTSASDVFNPNVVKVVANQRDEALYFSRSPIPYFRDLPQEEWHSHFPYRKHIGIYAFRSDVLVKVSRLDPSPLEKTENLEQLRWIDNGYRIGVESVDGSTIGIDTPDDLKRAEEWLLAGERV